MKRPLIFLGLCTILAINIIAFLVLYARGHESAKNGFNRRLPISVLAIAAHTNVNYNSWYMAGFHENYIYLGNLVAPRSVLVVDTSLKSIDSLKLLVPVSEKIAWRSMRLNVDFPHFTLIEGSTPHYFEGTLPSVVMNRRAMSFHPFDKALSLSEDALVFRTPDTRLHQNVLRKYGLKHAGAVSHHVLDKQVDGFFCTDGGLIYDPASAKLVYMYYYRNAFTVLDSNLQVLVKAPTIDTTKHVNLEIREIESQGKTTLSKPPKLINSQGCIYRGYLFLQSNLKSDNESDTAFKRNFVLDIYSLKNGSYLQSVYLPKLGHKRILDFKAFQNKLFVCYDTLLYKFSLPPLLGG